MGISDRYHRDWILEALGRWPGLKAWQDRPLTLYGFGERSISPPLEAVLHYLPKAQLTFLDKHGARPADLNEPATWPEGACDVVTLIRCSCFIRDPDRVLTALRAKLRPGGVVIADWLHGLSNAPVINLNGGPKYEGTREWFQTTYLDEIFLREHPMPFAQFFRHVRRPPRWANCEHPGRRAPWRQWLIPPRGPAVSHETYSRVLATSLERAGKHLVGREQVERCFHIVHRAARYFYPETRKFNLYLLTVLVAR